MFEVRIPLRGPAGEPVDFPRMLASHGVAELPPMQIDHAAKTFSVTLSVGTVARPRARTATVSQRGRSLVLTSPGRIPSTAEAASIQASARTILNLDEDLSAFYAMAKDDPSISWAAARGAGRMLRSATVFEEVVKTICTTNCAWSATERMVGAIVEHLGTPAPGVPDVATSGPRERAFPSPESMAAAGEDFYRDVARAGYRAASFQRLAEGVASGSIDLEPLATNLDLSDAEVKDALLGLPGVGPYAAAHVMMMLGRTSELILDSWTRPTYAASIGAKRIPTDATILRRFRHYGVHAGLAFWLTCTRDWIDDRAN